MNEYAGRAADALKLALLYREMTAEELAPKIGRSAAQLRRYARGESGLKAEVVVAIADALDIPTDLLLRPPATRRAALAMIAAWEGLADAAKDQG